MLFHSMKAGLLHISDLIIVIETGQIALLTLLDMRSAVNRVDHDILAKRMRLKSDASDTGLYYAFQNTLKQ